MMHPLLRYEWAIVRAEIALALPGWRDRLMLAAMVALGVLLLLESGTSAVLRERAIVAVVLGAIAGWTGLRAGERRLERLAYGSVIAPAALDPAGRNYYRGVILVGIGCALIALGVPAGPWSILSLLAGMATGAVTGAFLPLRILPRCSFPARQRERCAITPTGALAGHQILAGTRFGRVALPLAAALATVLIANALPDTWSLALRLAIPAAVAAFTMLLLTRVDAQCVTFLARAGYGAWRSAWLHLTVVATYAVFLLPLLAVFAPHVLGPCAAAVATFALFAVLRVWSYRAYSKRLADVMLVFGGAAAAFLATSFPPLLVPIAIVAAIGLLRRATPATWRMA
ncbi:hypothetical protein ABS767_08895 [Sphingomonas sp. ST-64]|uniref:Uncharacterized protein n=1 Tax=Sphingomonas plantiphila TaxID=3163295 RepID=A0ABW8YLD3_9SPHN